MKHLKKFNESFFGGEKILNSVEEDGIVYLLDGILLDDDCEFVYDQTDLDALEDEYKDDDPIEFMTEHFIDPEEIRNVKLYDLNVIIGKAEGHSDDVDEVIDFVYDNLSTFGIKENADATLKDVVVLTNIEYDSNYSNIDCNINNSAETYRILLYHLF